MPNAPIHAIFNRPLDEAVPHGFEQAIFGMGCYWGIERLFWNVDGVWMTEVGFAGGTADNPTYDQVCSGRTGRGAACGRAVVGRLVVGRHCHSLSIIVGIEER